MINRVSDFKYYGAKIGLLMLPGFCFALLLAAKTHLFALTIGMADSSKQALPQYLGTGGVLLVFLALSVLLVPRWRMRYLIAADVICSGLILLDIIFFRYFQDVMTIRSLPVAWHYLNAETVWWQMLRPSDLFLGADFLLLGSWLLYRQTAMKKRAAVASQGIKSHPVTASSATDISAIGSSATKSPDIVKFKWLIKLTIFGLLLLVGSGCCLKAYYLLEADQPGITRSFYSKVYLAQSLGEGEFRFLDFYRSLKTRLPEGMVQLSKAQKEAALADWLRSEQSPSAKTAGRLTVAKGSNLIVIQLESMQEFVIGKSINGQEITPNLNRLLKRSLYFNNYFGETWSGGTSDAEFMSNVSLYPISVGNAYIDYAGNDYVSLGKVLAEKGYYTVAMEADQPGFWNMDLMLRSEGFQHILDRDGFVHDLDIGMGLADHSMFRQASAYLERIPQPFYSFQVTLSSHYPFLIPEDYRTINVKPYEDKEFGHYLEAVHYTDQALGSFLDRLQADGLLDKSILAIYGDHQASFTRDNPELKRFLGYGDSEIDYYHWLTLQKVPMLIHLPTEEKTGIIETVGGHVDLFPTILGLLGEDAASYPILGQDLLNSSAPGLAISRNGLLVAGDALLEINQQKAYNLQTGEALSWTELQQEAEKYQAYLQNTDLIMKYDLQKSPQILLGQPSAAE
ncbi:MAG TPA: LTA synthase family protein [Desulfitobacteriaceae bacterium]|nr:LTA synthase family protein [Desulfitobacteriaceae bacterium]